MLFLFVNFLVNELMGFLVSFANTHITLLTPPPPLLSALVPLPPYKWPHYAFIGKYLNLS